MINFIISVIGGYIIGVGFTLVVMIIFKIKKDGTENNN